MFLFVAGHALAQADDPQIKKLPIAEDPTQKAVLIGRNVTDNMIIQLEIEGSEAMWMKMGAKGTWGEHHPTAKEKYHVELKLTDPKSKTRIPYVKPVFKAKNMNTGKEMSLVLPPMWGGSGLHYSQNSALLGDGYYQATVTVNVPTFHRELKDKSLWAKPISSKFNFNLFPIFIFLN